MKRKVLVVGIILLFIGVAVAPSINFSAVKASNDNDLVEVTTQACGIRGFGNTTVKLTKQQYQNLEQYLVNFRARLNQTTTREEAVPIFKEAVVELNKYGLLPKGMSIERAQSLVTRTYQKMMINNLGGMKPSTQNNSFDNAFCLIAGEQRSAIFMHIIVQSVLSFLLDICIKHQDSKLFLLIGRAIASYYLMIIERQLIPIPWLRIGTGIYFYKDNGNIITIGLLGIKSWNSSIVGGFQKYPDIPDDGYLGVIGFTGFQLSIWYPFNIITLFFGSALFVNLDS